MLKLWKRYLRHFQRLSVVCSGLSISKSVNPRVTWCQVKFKIIKIRCRPELYSPPPQLVAKLAASERAGACNCNNSKQASPRAPMPTPRASVLWHRQVYDFYELLRVSEARNCFCEQV